MQIFNYATFSTRLEKSTRTLHLTFYNQDDHLTLETLFELESLISWCQARVEINTLLISSDADHFNLNFNDQNVSQFKPDYIQKVLDKVAHLSYEMMNLPQTVIFDLGSQPHALTFQLSLGADQRIMAKDFRSNLSPFFKGLSPAAGSLSLAKELFGLATTKKIFFNEFCSHELLESLGVVDNYHTEKRITYIYKKLNQVNAQAPIIRIQAKLALTQLLIKSLEGSRQVEAMSYRAAHLAQDWKNFGEQDSDFTPAQHMAYILKFLKENHNKATATK